MNNGFERFKRRLRRAVLFRSIILAASCGTLATAGYMALQKMSTLAPELWMCATLGGGVALVVGLIAYWVMRPSEKTIAQKLDNDLGLDEKVQTMLAYRDDDSVMLTLQREDTNQRLANIPSKAVRYAHPWKHIFAPMLAGVLMVTAVMMPIKAVPPEPTPDEPTFEMGKFQQARLEQLIQDVKESTMDETPKAKIVIELESLLDNLNTPDLKTKEMKQMVVAVIVATNRAVRDANSADNFNLVFGQHEDSFISDLGLAVGIINGLQTQKVIDKAREDLRVEQVAEPLAQLIQAMETAMAGLGDDFDTQDPAYVAMQQFVDALKAIQADLGNYTRDWAQGELDGAFEALSTQLFKALAQQKTNKDMGDHVALTLMDIFELTDEDIPPEENPTQSNTPSDGTSPDEENDDNKDSQGGIGNQELLFGSDDTIFDPAQNQQVKYGDVLLDYHKVVSNKTLEGTVSEELQQFIDDYFSTLFDGSASKDEKTEKAKDN